MTKYSFLLKFLIFIVIIIIRNTYSIGRVTQVFAIKNVNERGDCVIDNITHRRHQHCVSSIYFKKNAPFIEDGYE